MIENQMSNQYYKHLNSISKKEIFDQLEKIHIKLASKLSRK